MCEMKNVFLSFFGDKRRVKFGENMRPNKTERERECEKSSESETVRQRDRVKRWPGQNLLGSSRPHA